MAGWNADTAAGPVGAGTVTLVEETSFCISLPNGDIHPDHPHCLFVQDTRFLSRWNLTVNSHPLESLAAETREPFRALFASRVPRSDGYSDSPLIVERLREVGAGIQEQLTVRNYSTKPVQCAISLEVEADFADLFEVKEARIQRTWDATRHVDRDQLTIEGAWQGMRKRVVIQAPGANVKPEAVTYLVSVPPHGHWSAVVSATAEVERSARSAALVHPDGEVLSPSDRRRKEWVAKIPVVRMSNRSIERALRRSYDDLGALRIEDPGHPERVVVANSVVPCRRRRFLSVEQMGGSCSCLWRCPSPAWSSAPSFPVYFPSCDAPRGMEVKQHFYLSLSRRTCGFPGLALFPARKFAVAT